MRNIRSFVGKVNLRLREKEKDADPLQEKSPRRSPRGSPEGKRYSLNLTETSDPDLSISQRFRFEGFPQYTQLDILIHPCLTTNEISELITVRTSIPSSTFLLLYPRTPSQLHPLMPSDRPLLLTVEGACNSDPADNFISPLSTPRGTSVNSVSSLKQATSQGRLILSGREIVVRKK